MLIIVTADIDGRRIFIGNDSWPLVSPALEESSFSRQFKIDLLDFGRG